MRTYADITVGTVWDGDVVTDREVFAGGDWEFIRLTTATGGRRTEAADFPLDGLTGLRFADPELGDMNEAELMAFVDAVNCSRDVVPAEWISLAVHGSALELHRRRALDCISRGCVRADQGCVCHWRYGKRA